MAEETAALVTPANDVEVLFCRIGTFYNDKEKPMHKFLQVVDGTLGTENLFFDVAKHTKHLRGVGVVYALAQINGPEGKRSWRIAAARFKAYWHDKEDRLTWDAEQEVRDAAHNAILKTKSAGEDSPLRDLLHPLRDLYKSQVGSNRAQLLAFIVKEITR